VEFSGLTSEENQDLSSKFKDHPLFFEIQNLIEEKLIELTILENGL
jgi:hypothetical protein